MKNLITSFFPDIGPRHAGMDSEWAGRSSKTLDEQAPRMISAFFGLDNAIPAPRQKDRRAARNLSQRVADPGSIGASASDRSERRAHLAGHHSSGRRGI